MSDKFSKNPKTIKLDADLTLQITDCNNNDDLCSVDNSVHGSSHSDNTSAKKTSSDANDDGEFGSSNSDNMSSADKTSSDESDDDEFDILNRKQFSCYDVISTEWLWSADELDGARIYVHREILHWIVSLINENLLSENTRATVEEVFHHNLNGQVYLIKFYKTDVAKDYLMVKLPPYTYIEKLTDQLKYKCVWETRPTYFLKIDSKFDEQKIQIMNELQKLNLHDSFKATSLDVNWMYIPKIEKYDFPEYLTDDQTNQIDLIFKNMSQSLSSLFICKQFQWHKDNVVGRYVDVNTYAMELCVEEWNRYDLLKDFDLENILDLDLAYKDYRNEFLDEYLDKYIHKLLLKLMPKLSSDIDDKLEFVFERLETYASHYFVSKFYNKIIILVNLDYHNLSSKHDIQEIRGKKEVDLIFNKPTPEELLMMNCYRHIVYNISNYNYFSDSLFRKLLNKPNVKQSYEISFGTDFQFRYEKNNKISPPLCQFKTLSIDLIDCTENNAEQLAIFIKYIFNLCKNIRHRQEEIHISLINCVLDDYSFLESVDRSIHTITFGNMNFPSSQVKLLSRFLTQQKMIVFHRCNITDTNVMTLLETIEFDRLYIGGGNECTPAVFFLMAEHLMNKKGYSNPIKGSRFSYIPGLSPIFSKMNLRSSRIEFFNTGDQIVIRDIKSKKIKSLFCTTEQNSDDESFDPIYNIYDE